MARIEPIPFDLMTEEQRRANDEIASTRGGGAAKEPFALWLRTPELADKANALGSYLRHNSNVPQNLWSWLCLKSLVTTRPNMNGMPI